MFHQRRQHKMFFTKICKRQKKSYRVSLFPKQVLSYQMNGKKVKASGKNMKKYRDLYEVEKQQYEEALQRYQEDHMGKKEIKNLHKICNKTDTKKPAKAVTKAGTTTVAKTGAKKKYHMLQNLISTTSKKC